MQTEQKKTRGFVSNKVVGLGWSDAESTKTTRLLNPGFPRLDADVLAQRLACATGQSKQGASTSNSTTTPTISNLSQPSLHLSISGDLDGSDTRRPSDAGSKERLPRDLWRVHQFDMMNQIF